MCHQIVFFHFLYYQQNSLTQQRWKSYLKLMYCIQTDQLGDIHIYELGNLTIVKEMEAACYRLQNIRYTTLSRGVVAILASTHQRPLGNFHGYWSHLNLLQSPSREAWEDKKVSRRNLFFPPGKCHLVQEGWQQSLVCWRRWQLTSFVHCCPLAVCPASPSGIRGKDSIGNGME